jgi:competence protein ComEA helix-hairpin-helix repeat region
MFNPKKAGVSLALVIAVLLVSLGAAFAQAAQAGQTKGKININTAGAAELESLPRIGPRVAQRIVDYRAKNGNYKKVEDIMKVQGIGEKIFAQIKDMITVGVESAAK